MQEISCDSCDTRSCFLFKNCSPEWHDKLNKNKSCVRYKKNQQIIQEGNAVMGMYFIQSGKVKVYKTTSYRVQIVRFAKGGDILGHRGIGGNDIYPISASTLADSMICFVEKDMLFQLISNNPMLSINMMMFYADELKKAETRMRNIAVMTVRERIADALLLVHETFGSQNEKSHLLDVELSRKDIAEIAGTYSEQASRYITEFKKDKILELNGKRILLYQAEKLREMIEKYDMDKF